MSLQQKNKIIVLGAGITGLITAWKLASSGKEITIIESTDSVGGLAKTYNYDGYLFDNGAHNFFTHDAGVMEFYRTQLPGLLMERERNFKLFIFGKLLKFPFLGADILLAFGALNLIKIGGSFFITRLLRLFTPAKPTPHLDEWIIQRYGRVLYRLYFKAYLQLVQKCDPHDLSSAIGVKKIPQMSLRKIARETYIKLFHKIPVNKQGGKSYYCKGGIGKIPDYFYQQLLSYPNVTFKFNEKLSCLAEGDGVIRGIQTDKANYDTTDTDIISTIPISALCAFTGKGSQHINATAQKLVYSKMRFFFVKVSKPVVTECWFVNFNDNRIPFYRISEEHYGDFAMVPEPGCSSLIFEISVNDDDELAKMTDNDLLSLLLEKLSIVFPLHRNDIIGYHSVFCQHANPRLVVNYQNMLHEIFEHLFTFSNLFSLGRQGFFTYANIDHCTRMALDFSESYLNGNAKEGNRQLFAKHLESGF